MHPRRLRLVSGAVLAGLVVFQAYALAPLFGPGEPAGDDNSVHLAEVAHLGRAIEAHDVNLWNPSANLGFASG